MAVNPLGMNQGTNSFIRFEDDGGTINTQVIDVRRGTVNVQGTVEVSNTTGTTVTVDHGTITLFNPTGTTVQFNNGTIDLVKAGTITRVEGGTIGLVTRVATLGTLEVGTISSLPNIPGGTIGLITRVGQVGTLEVGTISSLPNIPGGSIAVTAGTITEGTLRNLMSGTINAATAVITSLPNLPQGSINVTAGTIATLGTMGTLGLVNTVTSVTEVANLAKGTITRVEGGSIVMTLGTVAAHAITAATITEGTLRNLISGTINAATVSMTSGTINVGTFTQTVGTVNTGTVNTGTINVATVTAATINKGTIQIDPFVALNTISHAGTSGTLGIGTLVAAPGAATALHITNFRIVAISGTPEVVLAFGTQVNGNQVVHHGLFPAGGGIADPIPYPHGYGTTNSPLTYQILSGAGTVSWDVDYFAHT